MDRCQKGLDLLLEKYEIGGKVTITDEDVCIDGKKFPLLPWENVRRFAELRNIVKSGRIGRLCTYRIGHTTHCGADLLDLLEREAGILEFTADSPVKEVFAIGDETALNCILETESGCVCTVELAATLRKEFPEVDKHEIIAQNGVACDRVVDTQMPQNSIYVFGTENKAFTDTDFELFGYDENEIARIRSAFALAKEIGRGNENRRKKLHLDSVVKAAKQSLKLCEACKVDENGKG